MPSTDDSGAARDRATDPATDANGTVTVPADAATVAEQYRRLERPLSAAVAGLAALVGVGAVLGLPILPAFAVIGLVVVALRFPFVRSEGTARLRTAADAATVRAAFRGPTPPVLAFQWGTADEVRANGGVTTYEVSYLFGFRSTDLTVESGESAESADIELRVTAGGRPWATYTVTIRPADATDEGQTHVDVEWASARRFGLRRVPQWLVAERYRAAALAAQGYETVDRDASLTV